MNVKDTRKRYRMTTEEKIRKYMDKGIKKRRIKEQKDM
jgi:hypothetical protein